MNRRQKYKVQSFRRAQEFLDENDAVLPGVNGSNARKEFNALVDQLSDNRVSQDTFRNQLAADIAQLGAARGTLRMDHMRPIARIAAKKLKTTPEFHALRLPSVHIDNEALVTAAREMAQAAAPHKQVFIDMVLPPEFLERLSAATAALEKAITGRTFGHSARVGATRGIGDAILEAQKSLETLDAVVQPQLKHNAALLAVWKNAKRVPAKSPATTTGTTGSTTTGSAITSPAVETPKQVS